MYFGGRTARWDRQLPLLAGIVLAAVVAYVPLDRGSVFADLPEVIVPLGVCGGLVALTAYLQRMRLASEQSRRIVTFGWVGATAAAAVSGWWVLLHLVREHPVGRLSDQILTVVSLGIGAGVMVGVYTARQQRFARQDGPGRVLVETTWTSRTGPEPIARTVVEALAELEGVDPLELDPLYESVDPDAIERLKAHDGSQWQLLFYVDDYEVRVGSQGTVTVYDAGPWAGTHVGPSD